MEKAKIVAFEEGYRGFSSTLLYGALNLRIVLPHRRYAALLLPSGKRVLVGTISGRTPRTYHAGGRQYGKYIFALPPDIRVMRRDFVGYSNADADEANKALLRVPASHAKSLGFDLYEVQCISDGVGEGAPFAEVAVKIETFEIEDFGIWWNEAFIQHALPANLPEIISGFPYQCSGWTRNDDPTFLHAVTRVGKTQTWIPFAAPTAEIPPIEGIEMEYRRPIIEGPAQD